MSYRFSISPKDRKVGRFLGRVRRELQNAFLEESVGPSKISKSDIARALGVNRSVITRQLSGNANLTLSRLAEFAWALNRDLHFSLAKSSVSEKSETQKNNKEESSSNTPVVSLDDFRRGRPSTSNNDVKNLGGGQFFGIAS